MIHIIIPVHNRIELSKKCLESIDSQTYKDWCVYFVDDGSIDGTYEWLQNINRKNVKHLIGDGSLWWSGAMNKGIKRVLKIAKENDYIMSLNNDLIFADNNALLILLDAAIGHKKSICSSVSVSNNSNKVMSSGSIMISWFLNITKHHFINRLYSDIKESEIKLLDMLSGRSVIYPIAVFKDNNFDEVNFPQYGGDNEFGIRAKKIGYKLLLIPKSAVLVNRDTTGMNFMEVKLSLKQKINSLFLINSCNNILIKYKFAMKAPPLWARPTYFIVSMIKIFIQLVIGNYFIKK
jgi:hypothetical protein